MKRIISVFLVCILMVGCLLALASCSNISESYAKKINLAAERDEHITYTQVIDDLGDEAIDITILKSGIIIAVKGCSNVDELEDMLDEGKTVKGIIVTVIAGKATTAEYREISKSDFE